jgi:sortase A
MSETSNGTHGPTSLAVLSRLDDTAKMTIPGQPATRHAGTKPLLALRKPRNVRALAGHILLVSAGILVGFIVFVVFLSSFPQAREQVGLQRHFKTLLGNAQASIGGVIRPGTPVARIDIPALGVHQIVVEGTNADQLRKGPGHLPVSPLPGQIGNSVLAAHAIAYGGPFGDLRRLHDGDVIRTLTGQGSFTYRVTGHKAVGPSDIGPMRATPDNRLTMITASGLLASHRYVVTASLVGNPQLAPPGRPNVVSGAETGLAGGGGAGPALALWLEALLVGIVVTAIAYRRLPRSSSYLITTPVLLGLLWLLYSTLGRLLPATL